MAHIKSGGPYEWRPLRVAALHHRKYIPPSTGQHYSVFRVSPSIKISFMELVSRFDISASGLAYLCYNTCTSTWIGHVDKSCACTCAVSGQWLLSVSDVLVAQLDEWIALTLPNAPEHTTCRIGLLPTHLQNCNFDQLNSKPTMRRAGSSSAFAQICKYTTCQAG